MGGRSVHERSKRTLPTIAGEVYQDIKLFGWQSVLLSGHKDHPIIES